MLHVVADAYMERDVIQGHDTLLLAFHRLDAHLPNLHEMVQMPYLKMCMSVMDFE